MGVAVADGWAGSWAQQQGTPAKRVQACLSFAVARPFCLRPPRTSEPPPPALACRAQFEAGQTHDKLWNAAQVNERGEAARQHTRLAPTPQAPGWS